MLEIRELTKRYGGIPVVDHVSFAIRRGETLGYLGPNGAGKSTTVKMIIGLLEPTSGEIALDGRTSTKILTSAKPSSAGSVTFPKSRTSFHT
ncbi:MAG TPA: ATP-binding cassette domain-containing protein [Bryobacteraceae bacterium]|jgi:ABC-2 type transport system ATP-binding protein|nr:ATP-binding cassette domain-containing protein [Bryobacteraceae bacterium]